MSYPAPAASAWPLLFNYKSPIIGSGFVALVELRGRVLARKEDDAFWIEGVSPGAFTFTVPTLETANPTLHNVLTGILADFAEEHGTFAAFKSAVEAFCGDADADAQKWRTDLVTEIQSGKLGNPAGLPVLPATTPTGVVVTELTLENASPKNNPSAQQVLCAAA